MPKHSANIEETKAVLEIYNDAGGWQDNETHVTLLKLKIGGNQYPSSYTKKSQITSFFGFTEWEDIASSRSNRRITPSGKRFLEAWNKGDDFSFFNELVLSLETVNFGRNNFASPEGDSDIQAPCLFIRAILDVGYLTKKEFAFLLWSLEDLRHSYNKAILNLKAIRSSGSFLLDEAANRYTDPKPINMLIRWGFLLEGEKNHILINPEVLKLFKKRLSVLPIYNTDIYDSSKDFEPKIDDDSEEQTEIQNSEPATEQEAREAIFKPLKIVLGSKGKTISKSSRISKTALREAGYVCQVDKNHKTFITAKNVMYMEGHHLIPCTVNNSEVFKGRFDRNIDCVENIISLCPNCHRAVHFGDLETKTKLIEKMFDIQKDKFKSVGIEISLAELIDLYIQ